MDPVVDVTEQKWLNDAREAHIPWKKWGTTSASGRGGGPGGLQRRWRLVELLHPRPGALTRLSVGRRRTRGPLR